MDPDKYDPNLIIQSANVKLSSGDLEGGQMIFQSALLTWVDDAREGGTGVDAESLREAIATLWLAYAQFLASAKQFKSATEAYEQAVACPVASTVGRIWLDYARFQEDRGKLKAAQDIYMRALGGENPVTDEQDQELLWSEFLEMMKQSSPDLTMEELQSAVAMEKGSSVVTHIGHPEPVASSITNETDSSPPAKRPRVDSKSSASPLPPEAPRKTHVVTGDSVHVEATAFAEILQDATLPPEISAAWMVRDGNDIPQAPEHPLFGPSPPKLSDPTAKDMLGVELSLDVTRRLLSPSGDVVLETCRGLWALQAMKEKMASTAIDTVNKSVISAWENNEARLEARLSVAGAAITAVKHLNANERAEFQSRCIQERQTVVAGIAWELRKLLCVQQQVLSKLAVPGFDGPTVDAAAIELHFKICSYLHSAFYLRNRIGEAPHTAMLKSQVTKLEKEVESGRSISPTPYQQTAPPLGSGPPMGNYMMPQNYQQQAFNFVQPTPPMVGMPNYGYQQLPPQGIPQNQPLLPQGGYGGPPAPYPYYH